MSLPLDQNLPGVPMSKQESNSLLSGLRNTYIIGTLVGALGVPVAAGAVHTNNTPASLHQTLDEQQDLKDTHTISREDATAIDSLPPRKFGQAMLDKIQGQHVENFCFSLTPENISAIHQDLRDVYTYFATHYPELLKRYERNTAHQIETRTVGCDLTISELKCPNTSQSVYSRLTQLNNKYNTQPPAERVESFSISQTINLPAMTTVFPNNYNPTTNLLRILGSTGSPAAWSELTTRLIANGIPATNIGVTIIPTNVQFADANRNIISASGVALAGFGPGDPALEPDRLGSYGLPGLSFVRDSAVPTNVTDHEIGHNFIDGNHTPSNISCLMNASSGYPDFSAGKAAEISTTCAELGPSGLGYTADDCESNIILPIRLVSFDARYNDNTTSVQLDWTVASQVNTDRMHIERSIDGGITWEMIPDCDIAGAGSTSERMTYSCEDLSPVPGRINYYRLIDIDFDNTKNIGPIQAVHVPVSTDGTFYTGANPVSAGSMIDVHPEVPVQIIDMLGRVVSTSNNGVLQTPDQAGMYIMTDGSTTQKLIVQ